MLWNASFVRSWIPMSVIPSARLTGVLTSQDAWVADLIASPRRCNRRRPFIVCHGQEEVWDMTSMAVEETRTDTSASALRMGSWLMGIAAAGFIGYAVIFFIRNFTDSFLELGIGPNEVNVGKDQIQAFSPSLFEYVSHLHIPVSGFIAA